MGCDKEKTNYDEFADKERRSAAEYQYIHSAGIFPRYMMERAGLMRYANKTGKTRIVIEYDNDTGEGMRAVLSNTPIQINHSDMGN